MTHRSLEPRSRSVFCVRPWVPVARLGIARLGIARLGIGLMMIAGCESRGAPSPTAPELACPSPGWIREVHAAAFHFEHGEPATGHRHIAAMPHEPLSPEAARIAEALARIAASIEASPAEARAELEYLRVAFRDWPCLPDELHERLHADLPPRP